MVKGSATLLKAGKVAQGRHSRQLKLRAPESFAQARVRPGKPQLSTAAREILDRMKADENFFPDVDQTLVILGYR